MSLLGDLVSSATSWAADAFGWEDVIKFAGGLYLGNKQNEAKEDAIASAVKAADPFAKYREGYATILNDLYKSIYSGGDPLSKLSELPGYKFALDQGLKAVNSNAATAGMLNSGGRLQDLNAEGQKLATAQFGPEVDRLMTLAGVKAGNPGAAAQASLGSLDLISNKYGMYGDMFNRLYDIGSGMIGSGGTPKGTVLSDMSFGSMGLEDDVENYAYRY